MKSWGRIPEDAVWWRASAKLPATVQPPAASTIGVDFYRYLHHRFGESCAAKEASRYPR